jgi:hypothetical protein
MAAGRPGPLYCLDFKDLTDLKDLKDLNDLKDLSQRYRED